MSSIDRSVGDNYSHKISKQNASMFDMNNLPSCPFFRRVSVPTQPSFPVSFLELSRVRVPVGEPGLEGEDAMFVLVFSATHEPLCK